MKQPYPIILASGSSARQNLLQKLNLSFEVIPSKIPEEIRPGWTSPEKLVKNLALKKAEKVARKINRGIILGVDTAVFCNNRIYGKPKNLNQAKEFLRELSGKNSEIYTGLVLLKKPGKKKYVEVTITKVKMISLEEKEINYLARKHLDKAGAYGMTGRNDPRIKIISGEYENILGLPVKKLKSFLTRFGFRFA